MISSRSCDASELLLALADCAVDAADELSDAVAADADDEPEEDSEADEVVADELSAAADADAAAGALA